MPTTISTETLVIDGINITLSWKSGVRAMRIRITSPDAKAVATAPLHTSRSQVIQFLTSRSEWMHRAIEKVKSAPRPAPSTFDDGDTVWLFGLPYKLRLQANPGKKKEIYISGDEIILTLPPTTTATQRRRLLHEFFKQRLAIALDVYMRDYTAKLQCRPIPYRIMSRRSVWGTFHPATRTIIFNLQLIHVAPAYIQYIVLHEMTHQYVAAHNAAFYRRIAALMPDWRERRRALQQFARTHSIV